MKIESLVGKKIIFMNTKIGEENDIIYGIYLEDDIYLSFSASHEFDVVYDISEGSK